MMNTMELMTTREVAAALHVGYRRAVHLMATGKVPCIRLGGRFYAPRSAWDDWCRQQTQRALAQCQAMHLEVGVVEAVEAEDHAAD